MIQSPQLYKQLMFLLTDYPANLETDQLSVLEKHDVFTGGSCRICSMPVC